MNNQVYSREYLQNVPAQRKKDKINNIINHFIQVLQNAAADGKTSYMYVLEPQKRHHMMTSVKEVELTPDDLIAGFQLKFPDCIISYQEVWYDTNTTTRVLKKGIVIDWS